MYHYPDGEAYEDAYLGGYTAVIMLVKANIVEDNGDDDNPAVGKENESRDQLPVKICGNASKERNKGKGTDAGKNVFFSLVHLNRKGAFETEQRPQEKGHHKGLKYFQVQHICMVPVYRL